MNRVFYFTGHRLTVFHWERKEFYGLCTFEPDLDGMDKFKEYLKTSDKSASKLLVDVIEEDFRTETIPHVYGKDRRAVIGRLMDRYYRSSNQYVYAEIIGREKAGRRDDDVLLGGITNPYLIQPWMEIIEECDIPLSGVWTLPLLSKELLPVIGAKKGPVLLVSQQVNSNLRQTFFRDGKMLSSRQSVINQDAEDISKIGDFAAPEVDRTTDYLRNQKYIGMDEVIQIHVLGSDKQIRSLEEKFQSNERNDVRIHRVSDINEKLGLADLTGKFADELFSWLCANQWQPGGHYGENKEFSKYYYTIGSNALYVVSVLVALLAMLIAENNITSTVEYTRSVELLREQAEEYKKVYTSKFEAYEPVFTHARSMNAVVDLADRIYQHSRASPLDFMLEISDIITQSGVGKVQIDKIEWTTEQITGATGKKAAAKNTVDVTAEAPIQHTGILKGRIAVSDNNYRGSVSQVNRIIDMLMEHERIIAVEALDMPVEVRSERNFSDESGLDVKTGNTSKDGAFSLKITMKAPDHA